jgi:hypothetical protein
LLRHGDGQQGEPGDEVLPNPSTLVAVQRREDMGQGPTHGDIIAHRRCPPD